ncbi:MAG: hypothetical protein ACKPKO_08735, partial [Candidatus Fonsibacter sp.]
MHNGIFLTSAVTNLKTLLTSGGNIAGVTANTLFPQEQKVCYFRPPTGSYQSVWDTTEQQESLYSPVVTQYSHVLPETPMMVWKAGS